MSGHFVLQARRAATVLFVALGLLGVGFSPASASEGNRILHFFLDSDHLIRTCGKENQSLFSDKKIQVFDENFKIVEMSLTSLTQELHPQLTMKEAEDKVKDHIFQLRPVFTAHYGKRPCNGSEFEKRLATFEALVSDLFEHIPSKIFPPKYKYDTQIPVLKTSKEAKTYAQPSFQRKILDTFGAVHFKDGSCKSPDVIFVETMAKKEKRTKHLPPYILPPIIYSERWIVVCNGKESSYDIKFSQDSEGPQGIYNVLGPK